MRERRLFGVFFAAVLASVLSSGCSDDFDMSSIPDSDAEFAAAHPDGGGTVVPKPATARDTQAAGDSASSGAPAVSAESMDGRASFNPQAERAAAAHGGKEVPGWSMPNATFHNAVFMDISASLSDEDRQEAAGIVRERILAVSGANKVTVYLVGASYVRWPTAASDGERAALAQSVQSYLARRHTFARQERAYTNYALPLLDAMENGYRDLKDHGTRFYATIVGDGWNDEPPGQDSWFFQDALRECVSRVPPERRGMFSVELISVNTRGLEYQNELHLRDLFGDEDFPVYPAGSWADVRNRFAAIDRDLNGAYSWANINKPVEVSVSDFGEQYPAGVYELLLDAPTRASGEMFTAVLAAESEHSAYVAHLLGYWKLRGSEDEPIPISQGLVIPDKAEVEVFVGFNEESPPPGDVLWPLSRSVPFKVKLVPHGSVSLVEHGERPSILVERWAWLYRDWIPDKLLGIAVILLLMVLLLYWLNARLDREWGSAPSFESLAGSDDPVVGYVACNGRQYPIRRAWFEVEHLAVVPTPDGILIQPFIPCSMSSLEPGGDAALQPMQPGARVPLLSSVVMVRDSMNIVYEFSTVLGTEAEVTHAPALAMEA